MLPSQQALIYTFLEGEIIMEKEYTCICGREFKSQKALSGHHTQCKIFYLDRDGNLDNYYKRRINLSKSHKRRKIETKKCPYCEKETSKNHFNRHIQRHENGNFDRNTSKTGYYLDHDDLFCKFCGKECKNKNSLAQHEIRCKNNPDRINAIIDGFNTKGIKPWNKGLTKNTDKRLFDAGKKISKSLKGKPGRRHTDEEKINLRKHAIKNGFGGFNMRRKKSPIYQSNNKNSRRAKTNSFNGNSSH